jgi:hypothetical protein
LIETFEVFHEGAKLRERGRMEEGGMEEETKETGSKGDGRMGEMEGLSKIEEAKM